MVYTKVHFDLPGSLGKKENIKEYLIVLDAFDKTKYLGFFFFRKNKHFYCSIPNRIYQEVLIKGI